LLKTIFTVGTSDRSADEFFGLLEQHRIRYLVDVRRFPTSRKFPHFGGEVLAALAQERGLEYLSLGHLLGGYRPGGYRHHMLSSEFKKGLARLEQLAFQAKAVVLCAERFPWRCHRRFIAAALQERGWRVFHIIDVDRTWMPGECESQDAKSARGQIELDFSG
jgi:uncharacterized protein (DUF488 family)